jgi:adenine-specific DNA-methyltransferase
MASKAGSRSAKQVATLRHDEAKRKNIPTAEHESVLQKEAKDPIRVAYERRNRDLDPQLVWRGKDELDWSDLVVPAPPLYIQEKVQPKALIDDLLRQTRESKHESGELHADLFADFNGIPKGVDKTEFYRHEQNWSNRMILGDSLQVMASLAEREGLRGKVQCIYFDPPYGIKFNSNFQWSTTTRDVKDGNSAHITREPEQVKAFRDTWRDGIHSYLTYLRDRLTVARDLLTESGSIFVQIGDENIHRVRSLLDEVFGAENFLSLLAVRTTSGAGSFAGGTKTIAGVTNYIVWYARSREAAKYRQLYKVKSAAEGTAEAYNMIELPDGVRRRATALETTGATEIGARLAMYGALTSQTTRVGMTTVFPVDVGGQSYMPPTGGWKTNRTGMARLLLANRFAVAGKTIRYVRYLVDFPAMPLNNMWDEFGGGFGDDKIYVVQTTTKIIERCLLMASDPGDLVLDPTCGSGTTATVAEQWGRRWITIDTSRVALALARARIMGARYPYYLLADTREGQLKEGEATRSVPSEQPVRGDIRHGFVYERVPHITLKSIANNSEIDVIWEKWQETLEPLRTELNAALEQKWEEWEIPRDASSSWDDAAKKMHAKWWEARITRQKEIDASIAAKAEFEFLYDKPYQDNKKVRVAGPFTVESLSPHRTLDVDENDELIDHVSEQEAEYQAKQSFPQMIMENLRVAGVQQAHKDSRITFTSLVAWPGEMVCAEGRYLEGEGSEAVERRAAIFIGPEFGTVNRPDLVQAAKEAGDADFDVVIACAFNYDAHATELNKLGRINILKARMNADLHMSEDLKNTGKGNLFVIFGEPDISLLSEKGDRLRVKVNGVDVFHPATGEVRSDGPDGIACWFIDTDYNGESFFVRHAYFLGANDPYGALKTTLKSEINEEAWATLNSDTSRAFDKPGSGRIAVKVINHLGDEVMKVFKVA